MVRLNRNDTPEAENDFNLSFETDGIADIDAPQPPEIDAPEIDAPEPLDAPQAVISADGKHIVIKNKDGKQTVIVDGEVVSDVDVDNILSDIGPIIVNGEDVLKKGNAYTYSYSDGSENGKAIVIDTKKITADAMKRAKEAMKNVAPQIKKAKGQLARAREEMDREREAGRNERSSLENAELQKARAEMEQARQEMQKARAELDKVKAEMNAELEKQKAAAK